MQFIIQSASGNGNFETSGSSTDVAAQWTFNAYAGDAIGRNAGASAPHGTGAFTISSAGSVSGSASAVSAIPTVVGHDYAVTANLKYGTLHGAVVLTLGEGAPITAASGSGAGTTVRTVTYQAALTSFSIVVAPAGVNDIGYIDDVTLEDVGSYLSCSASVGVSMSASNGISAVVAGTASAYVHSGSASSVKWAASPGYFVSSATIDGVSSSASGTKVYSAMNTDGVVLVAATKYTRDNLVASAPVNIRIAQFAYAGWQRIGKYTYTAGVSDVTVTPDASGMLDIKVLEHLMLLDAAGFSYLIY